MSEFVCPRCGGRLIWQSDEMCREIYDGEYENDDEAIETYYSCMVCGCTVTVTDAPKNAE